MTMHSTRTSWAINLANTSSASIKVQLILFLEQLVFSKIIKIRQTAFFLDHSQSTILFVFTHSREVALEASKQSLVGYLQPTQGPFQ
jgi:hypothetical protein